MNWRCARTRTPDWSGWGCTRIDRQKYQAAKLTRSLHLLCQGGVCRIDG